MVVGDTSSCMASRGPRSVRLNSSVTLRQRRFAQTVTLLKDGEAMRGSTTWRRGAMSGNGGGNGDGNGDGDGMDWMDTEIVGQGSNGNGLDVFLDKETLTDLRRLEGLAESIMDLQSSSSVEKLRDNIRGVTTWKKNLSAGLLPDDDIEWPDETFRTALLVRETYIS